MRTTNESLGRSLARLLDRIEEGDEGASGTATPVKILVQREKGVDNSGLGTTPPTILNLDDSAKTSSGAVGRGAGGTGQGGGGKGAPRPVNTSFGRFHHRGGFTFEGARGGACFEYRHRKVDMLTFDRKDPDGWILQAERYFTIYQLIDEEKIEAAVLSLNGDALAWYRWTNRQQELRTWEEIKAMLLKRFRPIHGGDLYEQWPALVQTGTTDEYVRRFIELSAPLEGVTEHVALGNFLNGLKAPIKSELRLWAPQTWGRAIDLAQQIEEKNRAVKASGYGALGYRSNHTSKPFGGGNQPIVTTPNKFEKPGTDRRASRTLTETQIQDKRNRGLCYRCDERWHRVHVCKFQVNVILLEENDGTPSPEDEHEESPAEEEEPVTMVSTEIDPVIGISLNSVAGLTTPKTMKIKGNVEGQDVVTLIDPGATHNFIASHLVTKLGLPVEGTRPYGVKMGTGDNEPGEGICRGVRLQISDLRVTEDFLPLRLGSSDVILGIKWLETLGMTNTNRKEQTMEFMLGEKRVRLQGDKSLGVSLISLKAMTRALNKGGEGLLVELSSTEVEDKPEVPPFLVELIDKFEGIVREPTGLPPARSSEHQIIIKEGTPPVSVRPYRYPHFQKAEIERMIEEMLRAEVIQPRN
ncbi:hypothetical protein LXL04_021871 [Taraxacum kok-saghyz]